MDTAEREREREHTRSWKFARDTVSQTNLYFFFSVERF
jgi:hypothetical protein